MELVGRNREWRTAGPLAKELDDGGVVAKQQDTMSLQVRSPGQQTAVNRPQFFEVEGERKLGGLDVTTSQVKPGREMDRSTNG